jgi:dipeptidyl aminopeptidase/acylaminoacyl peptidase
VTIVTNLRDGIAMTSSRTPVTATDLTGFADITDVALTSDGQRVVAVTTVPDTESNSYRRRVVVGPAAGGDLTPLEPGDVPIRMPRWSPAGHLLAVVTDTPAGCGVRTVDTVTGAWATLLDGWPDPIEELCWSPDGGRLLFVVREPVDRAYWELPEDRRPPLRLTRLRYREDGIGWLAGRPRQAYLLDLPAGGETAAPPRKLSAGGFDDAEFSWHPDGRSVFFCSQRQPDADRSPINAMYRQELDGEPVPLTGATHTFGTPIPSPDGSRLACTVVDVVGYPAATHLAVLDVATGRLTDLTAELDRDVDGGSVVWTDDATILAIVAAEGRIGIRRFDVDDAGTPQVVVGGDRRITAFDVAGDRLVAVRSGIDEPPVLVTDRLSRAAGPEELGATVLHDPNAELRRSRDLAGAVHAGIEVAPGVTVDSWLVRPDPARFRGPHPVILWLQGGGTQYGYQFSHEMQLLVSSGYAVLYCNPRGSAGYGTDWMRTVCGTRAARPGSGWGGDDIADAAAVVRATLGANPDLDPARVGVMGGSYGGLVTTQLLAQTDLFAAGWAERGPYNVYSDAGTKDEAPWFFVAYLGGSHLDDAESYWRASPLRRVADITSPLMIVHSENDFRCTVGQAEELFMALKLLDREVELVRFPGEGHSLTRNGRPVHRLQRLELLLEWFGRHLAPLPA